MKISAICILAIALAFCGSSNKLGEKYPKQVRSNFINGCAGKLPPEYKSSCACMLGQIEKSMRFQSISNWRMI